MIIITVVYTTFTQNGKSPLDVARADISGWYNTQEVIEILEAQEGQTK